MRIRARSDDKPLQAKPAARHPRPAMGRAPRVRVIEADLALPDHQRDVVTMTAAYALDVMGNGGPLPPDVLERLVPALREHPTTMIFLAYIGAQAVGIATCFLGFSTFAARPLINIHDLAVLPDYRGRGIGQALLETVVRKARARGCVKVTLEVREDNTRARRVYTAAGFRHAVHGETTGGSLFYTKLL
jgi:ribosomal protein S18 acetylase RimI-like enzyme